MIPHSRDHRIADLLERLESAVSELQRLLDWRQDAIRRLRITGVRVDESAFAENANALTVVRTRIAGLQAALTALGGGQ